MKKTQLDNHNYRACISLLFRDSEKQAMAPLLCSVDSFSWAWWVLLNHLMSSGSVATPVKMEEGMLSHLCPMNFLLKGMPGP